MYYLNKVDIRNLTREKDKLIKDLNETLDQNREMEQKIKEFSHKAELDEENIKRLTSKLSILLKSKIKRDFSTQTTTGKMDDRRTSALTEVEFLVPIKETKSLAKPGSRRRTMKNLISKPKGLMSSKRLH